MAEIRPHLRRWLLVTGAAVVVLVGLGFLGYHQYQARRLANPVPMSVFLTKDVTPEQREAVGAYIRTLDVVGEIRFEDQATAYENFVVIFKDYPELIAQTRPESLPTSYRFSVNGSTDRSPIVAHLNAMPGVEQVVNAWPAPHAAPARLAFL